MAFIQELSDLVQCQGIVLRNIAVPHLLLQDLYIVRWGSGIKASALTLLFAAHEVFQKVDGHLLCEKKKMMLEKSKVRDHYRRQGDRCRRPRIGS